MSASIRSWLWPTLNSHCPCSVVRMNKCTLNASVDRPGEVKPPLMLIVKHTCHTPKSFNIIITPFLHFLFLFFSFLFFKDCLLLYFVIVFFVGGFVFSGREEGFSCTHLLSLIASFLPFIKFPPSFLVLVYILHHVHSLSLLVPHSHHLLAIPQRWC